MACYAYWQMLRYYRVPTADTLALQQAHVRRFLAFFCRPHCHIIFEQDSNSEEEWPMMIADTPLMPWLIDEQPIDAQIEEPIDAQIDKPIDEPIDAQIDEPIDAQID